jgi:hypothetical protein
MHKRSRRGHPERSGEQQFVRERLFDIFELYDKTGHGFILDEVHDCLFDEARARGLNVAKDLFVLSSGAPRHGGVK